MKFVRDAWRKNAPELAALFNGALPPFVTARRPAELNGVPVFSFHLVSSASFEADLAYLRDNDYQTLNSAQLLDHLSGVRAAPTRSAVLTFDDGPRNFHDVALPLLQKYAARAIAFVAPGLHADEPVGGTPDRPMSWSELAAVHASGLVEVQSHTLESRHVPHWPRAAALSGVLPAIENSRRRAVALSFAEDLSESRRLLESRLPGLRVDQLAFPQYLGTPEAVATSRALGFRACYWGLTPGRPLNVAGDSPFHIVRVNDEFLRRLPGRGRLSLGALAAERWRRIVSARQWRQSTQAA